MKTLIITGGSIEKSFALPFIAGLGADFVIAADRGLLFCHENGLRPDYILGDFDSLPSGVLDTYRDSGIPIREFNPVKDATDTCIALEYALDRGSSEIWLLGATGGRIDHLLCNIQILKSAFLRGVPAYIVDSRDLLTLPVERRFKLSRAGQYGKYVSFFPLEDRVEGLTLRGFKYPLENFTLRNETGLGQSNEITSETAEVSWESGILIMVQSRD